MGDSLFATEAQLDQILLGPDSVAWRVTSDLRLYFAMLYPLLLQVAHPTVGAGVRDFSDFERRPWHRLLRTVDYTSLLVYGGTEAAAAGQRLRSLHQPFRGVREDGERYSALEPDAYAWVHATLIDMYVCAHARFGTPLGHEETERFYLEYRGLGRLIGVREEDLPPTWEQFRSYFRRTAERELRRTVAVDRVLHTVRHVGAPPVPLPGVLWPLIRIPAHRVLWLGGVGLLTPSVRRRLGVRWSPLDEAQFRALGIVSRSLTPMMPQSMRIMGPGHVRLRREAIARGPLGDSDSYA